MLSYQGKLLRFPGAASDLVAARGLLRLWRLARVRPEPCPVYKCPYGMIPERVGDHLNVF
jgi:hypothetical protein